MEDVSGGEVKGHQICEEYATEIHLNSEKCEREYHKMFEEGKSPVKRVPSLSELKTENPTSSRGGARVYRLRVLNYTRRTVGFPCDTTIKGGERAYSRSKTLERHF